MDKLFNTKIFDNYLMDDNGMDTSDDENSGEINRSSDDTNSDIEEAPISYHGKRLTNQNGELVNVTQYNDGNFKNSAKQKIQRQPTRRPDPRVCNRNALMARENRRRKKELTHQMENQINNVSNENKYLKKLVKQQGVTISKLNNEKLYYKSIISNRTEIIKLLQVIGTSNIPVTSSEMRSKPKHIKIESNSLCTDSSDECENGTFTDPLLAQVNNTSLIDENYFLFPDLGCDTPSSTLSYGFSDSVCGLNGWDNLLNLNELMPIFSDESQLENKASLDIKSEHNYTYSENDIVKPGVCLHVSNGRVSLEFCASCHNRAQDAYLLD